MKDETKIDRDENLDHYIYVITNIINGKLYIGYSKDPHKRWIAHKAASNVKKPLQYIHRAMRKYNYNNFIFDIIEQHPTKTLCREAEIFYIAYFKFLGQKLYNVTTGGEAASGLKHTEATKEKMRQASLGKRYNLGYKHTPETKEKMGKAQRGRKHSDITKEKIRQNNLGKKHAEESKEKISQSRLGFKHTEETRAKMSASKLGHKTNLSRKATVETKQKLHLLNRGSKNNSAKLTDNQVIEIYTNFTINKNITRQQLCDNYNMSKSAISKILSGKTWSHLTKGIK
jgi:group I intron endonuclease